MEYEAPKKVFRSLAQQGLFLHQVLEAFESAQGHAELILLYQAFEPRLECLRDSSFEYDQMGYEYVMARYRGIHERIDEQQALEKAMFRCSCNAED